MKRVECGIDLIIDAAQSLGVLPVHPEEHGIAAVTGSTWKWLLASRGAGLFYTTPALREKLLTQGLRKVESLKQQAGIRSDRI